MIYWATACALIGILLTLIIGCIGVVISYVFQPVDIAVGLAKSYFINFNGLLVGGFGCGAFWYIRTTQANITQLLSTILDYDVGNLPKLGKLFVRVNSWSANGVIGIVIMLLGGFILWSCGYPHTGFAKYFLGLTTISMYFFGGHILAQFMNTIFCFRFIEKNINEFKLSKSFNQINIDSMGLYITISTTFALVALYVAFRGTLTADFTFSAQYAPIIKKALVFPMVLFTPALIFYNFYPKMVLKKVYDNDMHKQADALEKISNKLTQQCIDPQKLMEAECLMLEIKERMSLASRRYSLVSYKDSPALVTAALLLLQYFVQRDPVVTNFFNSFIK